VDTFTGFRLSVNLGKTLEACSRIPEEAYGVESPRSHQGDPLPRDTVRRDLDVRCQAPAAVIAWYVRCATEHGCRNWDISCPTGANESP
jgi:hypothetical protein